MLPMLGGTGYACLLGSSKHRQPCRIGKEIRLALIRLRKAVKRHSYSQLKWCNLFLQMLQLANRTSPAPNCTHIIISLSISHALVFIVLLQIGTKPWVKRTQITEKYKKQHWTSSLLPSPVFITHLSRKPWKLKRSRFNPARKNSTQKSRLKWSHRVRKFDILRAWLYISKRKDKRFKETLAYVLQASS